MIISTKARRWIEVERNRRKEETGGVKEAVRVKRGWGLKIEGDRGEEVKRYWGAKLKGIWG